jgi:hypothetical protein
MSSRRFHGGLVTLLFLLSCCRLSLAIAPAPLEPAPSGAATPAPTPTPAAPASSGGYFAPINPGSEQGALDQTTPALRALPVESSDTTTDGSTHRKFYTLTASLRETYDDNVNTTSTNKQASLETELNPSVLVDFPSTTGDLTARYTLGLTYYADISSTSGNGNNQNNNSNTKGLQVSHEVVAQYSHNFSDRFQLGLAESFRYFTEPSIMQSTGTNYQNGNYVSNSLTANLTAQLTPLWSATGSFGDTVVRYDDSAVGDVQNSVENNGSVSFGYALYPKITTSAGIIVDNISYQTADRGYTTYTGFFGASWQALPSLTISARGGGTVSETAASTQGQSQTSEAPYGALTVSWTLGARSSLSFNYAHEVTPSDQIGANGQISDRLSAGFSYQITPSITAHLDGIFTASDVSGGLAATGSASGYQENVYQLDTGFVYQYTSYLSFDTGIIISGVNSNIDNNNYTRDEAYVGVRGTY